MIVNNSYIDYGKAEDVVKTRTPLEKHIDFMVLVSATNANPNGDPLDENRPRTDSDGIGEISAECIKRKIRNRMQDMGAKIYVQADERIDDGKQTLKERALEFKDIKVESELYDAVCDKWLDTRAFGTALTLGGEKKGFGVSNLGVRGPVSIQHTRSVDPVEIVSYQLSKSTSWERGDKGQKGSDTFGDRHFVNFGLYLVKVSIIVQLAEKTGFTVEDAEMLKNCLASLFINDASAARPDGSMEVLKVYWWEHPSKNGRCNAAKIFRSVHITHKLGVEFSKSVDDYIIERTPVEGVACTESEGF